MDNSKIEEQVTRDCPILFQMRHRPCRETCMCWGFECNEGWHEAIASACRELEMLNIQYYPKYRVRIQADQIKEKYGTLHFYWSVVVDPSADAREDSAEVRNCIELLDRKARKIVSDVEVECESICERCGQQIGTDWSPVCRTTGYITYICDDCAEKLGQNYLKNGELWNGKTLLKTKEEMSAARKEANEDKA